MMYRLLRTLGLMILLGTFLPGGAVADPDLIRKAEIAGYVTPLSELLDSIKTSFPGRVLKVNLAPENEDGDMPSSWIYELKVLQSDGTVLKILFDAKTLVPLEVNGAPYGQQDIDENR